jgi:hypothetical protein
VFDQTGRNQTAPTPHRTEDTPIDPASINLISPSPEPWFGANAPPIAATLADAFEGNVRNNSVWNGCRQGVYVPAGVQTRSLWAVVAHRDSLTFVEDFEKLKSVLDDGAASYKLAVSSRALKEAWRNGGLAAVNQAISRKGKLHVRVGLARTFGNPADKCYVMINGVHW